jgi:hypothetical protein
MLLKEETMAGDYTKKLSTVLIIIWRIDKHREWILSCLALALTRK